jgi:hypothetical protein
MEDKKPKRDGESPVMHNPDYEIKPRIGPTGGPPRDIIERCRGSNQEIARNPMSDLNIGEMGGPDGPFPPHKPRRK